MIFFLLCLKNKEIIEAIKKNYINNKYFFIIFFVYIGYLVFQIIPLPLNWFEVIAPANHALYSSVRIDKVYWSLSLDPSNSYFRILNCINFFIIFLIFPALFFRSKHLMKVLFFFCFLGFCHAVFATYWMLIGNPSNFLISSEIILYFVASSACFFKFANCFSCCLLSSSDLFKLFSAEFSLNSDSCLRA